MSEMEDVQVSNVEMEGLHENCQDGRGQPSPLRPCKEEEGIELPNIMASLDISEDRGLKTSQRTKFELYSEPFVVPCVSRTFKRRCVISPVKSCRINNLRKLRRSRYLETIFEEPSFYKPKSLKSNWRINELTKKDMQVEKLNSLQVRAKRETNIDDLIARCHELMRRDDKETPSHSTDLSDSKQENHFK